MPHILLKAYCPLDPGTFLEGDDLEDAAGDLLCVLAVVILCKAFTMARALLLTFAFSEVRVFHNLYRYSDRITWSFYLFTCSYSIGTR